MERKATVFYKAGELSYSFPFLYLSKAFVKVKYISATGTTYLTYAKDYDVEDKKVVLKVAGSTDNTICIYRETPTDSQVTFVDASVLRAYDMNQQEVQLLHIAEETADNMLINGMTYDEATNAWQGNSRRLSNLSDPTEAQDAVTKHYMESVQDGFVQQNSTLANAAATSANAAKTSETNSATSASASAASASNAKVSETNAKVSETNAKVSETNAKVSETNAKVSETNCSTMQDKVTTDTTACESAANFASSMAVMTNNPINVGTYHADHSFAWYLANNNILSTDAAKSAENAKASETNAAASAARIDVGITKADLAYSPAGAHNALYRGKDLTSYFDSGAMSTAIANGTFTDIYPGDYITKSVTINGTTYANVKWVVGDCDYHLHRGDTETTTHHVLVFPCTYIGSARMNATNVTIGAYVGSEMWTTTIPLYATGIINAFGSAHVLTHREFLSKTEVDTIPSMVGCGNNGASTDWAWADVKVNLFNEPMIYGGKICSSSLFDVGECNTQVAAMRHDKSLSFTRYSCNWLRAVALSTGFAYVGDVGYASWVGSSTVGGVRPYFLLY